MRRLQIYTWWWSSGVRITRFVGLMRHTPGASCPPPRPNGSLCSSNTEVCQFVRFGNLALSWMTLASLSWMFFKIAYRLGRRSAAKGVDQVEGSCFVEESKKNRKRRTNPCLMPVKLKFFVAYRNFTNSCNIVKTFFCAHAWWVVLHMMDGSDVVSLRGLAFGRGHNEPHNKLRTSLGYRRMGGFQRTLLGKLLMKMKGAKPRNLKNCKFTWPATMLEFSAFRSLTWFIRPTMSYFISRGVIQGKILSTKTTAICAWNTLIWSGETVGYRSWRKWVLCWNLTNGHSD